jgi:hypothetical protein
MQPKGCVTFYEEILELILKYNFELQPSCLSV